MSGFMWVYESYWEALKESDTRDEAGTVRDDARFIAGTEEYVQESDRPCQVVRDLVDSL